MADVDLNVSIAAADVTAMQKVMLFGPERAWLGEKDRKYADLVVHPMWCYLAARAGAGDREKLQAIVLAHGTPDIRRRFAENVEGADKTALLAGI